MKDKKIKIIFWSSTLLIFLFEGVMPALTGRSEMAIQGITRLGYPVYFATLLTVFKVLGSIGLVINKLPLRVKEWIYAGFAFDFIFAFLSLWIVDGLNATLLIPALSMFILSISYRYYRKMRTHDLA
jgi:hypothetical protein